MYIIVIGAGKIGKHLVKILIEEEHDVMVIDKDGDVCHEIANEFECITIRGDGSKPRVLEEAGITEADAVVSLTGSDETNLIISLMAKQMGAKHVASRLGALHYEESVLKKLGLDLVIYPEAAAAGYISELITKPELLDLAFIGRGDAEIIEAVVTKKSKIINKKIKDIEQPKGTSIIALYEKGKINIPNPDTIIEEGDKIIVLAKKEKPQKSTAYCSTPGLPFTRQLISENLKDEEGIDISADDIIITTGGTEGLYVTLQTLVNPGDEVITTDPSYLGYDEAIKLAGGKEINVPIYWDEEFQILEERFKEKITGKTKLAIVISPDNPTGGMQSHDNMKAIIEICEDKKIWLLTDDIYKDMVFEGKFSNSRKFGGYENTITCCSFSKSASLPGARLGYTYGPTETIRKISEIKQATSLAAPTTTSLFIDGFLKDNARIKKEYIKNIVFPTYKKRRDYMGEMIEKYTDLEFHVPKGAFYYFIDVKQEDELFCDKLLNEQNVVAIPGKYFGENGKNHIRLTFVSEAENRIEEGIKKLGKQLE